MAADTEPIVRRYALALLVAGTVVVLFLALRLRLPNLGGRPLGFDEAFHSGAALDAPDLASLRRAVTPQFQPLLDHFLRRFVWAPLVGTQEIGIRLPAMCASLLAVLATILAVAWGFIRSGRSRVEAIIAALAVGVWHAGHGQDIGASGFARHYALTGCLSIVWTGFFLFGQPERSWKRLALVSLLFANTHFFSLAMIGTGYAYLVIEHVAASRRRAAAREAGVFVAIVALTAVINWPALSALLLRPLEARSHVGLATALAAIGDTRVLLGRLIVFLAFPVLPALLWLVLVAVGVVAHGVRRSHATKLVSLACLAVPALFFLGSLRSTYHIEDRYFMPFWGLAPALLALGGVAMVDLLQKVVVRAKRDPGTRLGAAAVLPIAAFLLVAGVRLALRPGNLETPQLPTRRAGLIDALKRESRPVFLLASPCWADAVVRLYWNSVGIRAPKEFLVRASQPAGDSCVIGGFAPGSPAEAQMRDFLGHTPDGILAFYQHHFPCFRPRRQIAARLISDSTDSSCLLILDGVRSVDEAREAAESVGYPVIIGPLIKHGPSPRAPAPI